MSPWPVAYQYHKCLHTGRKGQYESTLRRETQASSRFLSYTSSATPCVPMTFPEAPPHPSLVKKDPELLKTVDERISFDQESSQWLFEDEDGSEYQYNFILQKWLPLKRQLEEVVGQDDQVSDVVEKDAEIESNKESIRKLKKQKLEEMKKGGPNSSGSSSSAAPQRVNTGIFISNLPQDITREELEEMTAKFGLITEDFKSGEKRIKLYYESTPQRKFKGEAFIIYYNKESVDLAIQMLDETVLRGNKIRVEPARFDPKRQPKSNSTVDPSSSSSTGPGNGAKKQLSAEEKRLLQNKAMAMKEKLADWGEGEAETSKAAAAASLSKADLIKRKIWEKTIVIENMFRPEEIQEDPSLEFELKQDIQEECDKLGIGNDITKIFIYEVSKVVTIKFNNSESSEKCIAGFGGRWFDGLKLRVLKYSGEKFQGRDRKSKGDDKDEENEKERIDKFGDWLEGKAANGRGG